jgi:hypothetical protein
MCSKLLRIRPPQAETPHLDSLQNAAANINGPASGFRSGSADPNHMKGRLPVGS